MAKTPYIDLRDNSLSKNYIINGGFDYWQRNTIQTSNGYGSDDRGNNANTGSTKTHSRQTFANGQTDVPGNPTYFSRTVVSSVAGAGNLCAKTHKIEYTSLLAGKTVTLSFYAKADANKNIAVEFTQSFGTGGSPSSDVYGISVTTVNLTTSWQKFTITTTLPSIAGKTFGTSNNNSTEIIFWFDAGSSFNSRTNSLGQQSGTFDIAQVMLNEGTEALDFKLAGNTLAGELALCQRYYEKSFDIEVAPANGPDASNFISNYGVEVASIVLWVSSPNTYSQIVKFKVDKRATPTLTQYGNNSGFWCYGGNAVFNSLGARNFTTNLNPGIWGSKGFIILNNVTTNALFGVQGHWTADAEL